MDHSQRDRIIELAVSPFQLLAAVLFILWFKDTDILFGHTRGSNGYLIAAFVLAATSVAGRVFLWVQVCRTTWLTPEDSGLDGRRTGEKPLWRKGLSTVLFLFSVLIVLISLLDFAEQLRIIR